MCVEGVVQRSGCFSPTGSMAHCCYPAKCNCVCEEMYHIILYKQDSKKGP